MKAPPQGTKDRSDVLSKAYHKAMERIQQQKGDLSTDAMTILAWVVNSKKPLSIRILRLILAIDVETSKIDEDNFPTTNHITQACAPLVVIESGTQIVRLVHYTVQEYLERSNNPWMEKSQTIIANVCMSYLSFSKIRSIFSLSENNYDNDDNVLYKYAAEFWGHHTAEALAQGFEAQRVADFLENNTQSDLWCDSLMQIYLAVNNFFATSENDLLRTSEHVVALHVAACLGLPQVVAKLISEGYSPDVRDKRFRSPLWWAAYNGHASVVEILLQLNVNIEVKDSLQFSTPLKLAARHGAVSTVRLLLQNGADVESGNKSELLNLQVITMTAFSRLLCSRVNHPHTYRKVDECRTPLESAVKRGHKEISALLLKNGAKTEIRTKYQPTISALHIAITTGRDDMVDLLLKHGADMEMRDEDGSTALQIAAKSNAAITELLLKSGADIDSQDKDGLTALQIAAKAASQSVVEILLAHGADVEIQDNKGWTVLHHASWHDESSSIVKLLLAKGGDTEAKNEEAETPLIIAIRYGSLGTVKALIEHGADMAARDRRGRSILSLIMIPPPWLPADYHQQSMITLIMTPSLWLTLELLASKSFTPEKDDVELYGGHLLHIAIDKNDLLVVDWLLKNNVDVNYYDVKAKLNPLHRAVERGDAAIVARLLEVDGIDAEARAKRNEFDALTMTLRKRNKEIAKLLIHSGKVHTAFGRPEFLDFLKKSYC